jgi:hypothetical protein
MMADVQSDGDKMVIEPLNAMNEEQVAAECDRAQGYFNEVLAAWDAKDAKEQVAKLEARLQAGEFGAVARVLGPAFNKCRSSAEKARIEHEAIVKRLEKYIREYDAPGVESPTNPASSAAPATPTPAK